MKENAAVTAERKRLAEQYASGLADGYAQMAAPLPAFYAQKTLIQLTAYERGYFVGQQLAMEEAQYGK